MTDDRVTLGERYSSAVAHGATNADVLLAAGYAAQANADGLLGLALWRMREAKDREGFDALAAAAANWVIGRSKRPGRYRLPPIRRCDAEQLARTALQWWLDDTCPSCEGRAHPTIPGAARLDYGHDCPACEGTGKIQVASVVTGAHREHARWLAGEFDAMAGRIFRDMAERLRPMLDMGI